MVPEGVIQTVLGPLLGFFLNLAACLAAIRLPEVPESKRHFKVIGLAFPRQELSQANTIGLMLVVFVFLWGWPLMSCANLKVFTTCAIYALI